MTERPTTIVNVSHDLAYDVYIGRPTAYENPQVLPQGASLEERDENIAMFQEHFDRRIAKDPWYKGEVEKLRGLRLGCHCAPLPCHGDVFIKWLEENKDES